MSIPKAEILKIFRVVNNFQESSFDRETSKIGGEIKHLWHGTLNPFDLIKDRFGFSLDYSKESEAYGKGIYFSEEAKYSNSFTYCKNGVRTIILAKVLIGKQAILPVPGRLKACPNGFDSVKVVAEGSSIHIIYEQGRACPEYLIDYKVWD